MPVTHRPPLLCRPRSRRAATVSGTFPTSFRGRFTGGPLGAGGEDQLQCCVGDALSSAGRPSSCKLKLHEGSCIAHLRNLGRASATTNSHLEAPVLRTCARQRSQWCTRRSGRVLQDKLLWVSGPPFTSLCVCRDPGCGVRGVLGGGLGLMNTVSGSEREVPRRRRRAATAGRRRPALWRGG